MPVVGSRFVTTEILRNTWAAMRVVIPTTSSAPKRSRAWSAIQ